MPISFLFKRKPSASKSDRHGWDEKRYLDENPDVATAVASGQLPSGYEHYMQYGKDEGRAEYFSGNGKDAPTPIQTRLCLDPWRHLEFKANGKVIPCCIQGLWEIGDLNDDTYKDSRNNTSIRTLRQELLTGNINPICTACHIRPWGTLNAQIALVKRCVGGDADLLDPGKLISSRIDITEHCNLRCVYCPVSQPWYEPQAISAHNLAKIDDFLSAANTLESIEVNGHGETTYHESWKAFCDGLLKKNHPLAMITNFARLMEAGELETLSGFETIQVSIDTADAELLKTVRRKVDLRNIVTNIIGVRKTALARNRRPPKITFSCGVYDKSVFGIVDFAFFCIACKIEGITFWPLKKYPDVEGAEINVHALESLDEKTLSDAIDQFEIAANILSVNGIPITIAGEFVRDLKLKIGK